MSGHQTDGGKTTPAIREPRRATGQALQHWDALRGERRYPTRAEVADRQLPALRRHVFLVAPDGDGRDCRFAEGGAELGALCGVDPYGQSVEAVLPEAFQARAIQWMETAIQLGRPLAYSCSFPDGSGAEILCRTAFMPLSDDQRRVDSLLGAISFKRAPLH